MFDYTGQARQPVSNPAARAIEEINAGRDFEVPARPATHRHRPAIRRDRHRIDLTLIARPDGKPQSPQQGARAQIPHPRGLVLGAGHQVAVGYIDANSSNHGLVHSRLNSQDRLARWFPGPCLA